MMAQMETASVQLHRAEKLLLGLQSESVRWSVQHTVLKQNFVNLIGNVCLSSAYVNYLGPFNKLFRGELIQNLSKLLQENQIPTSPLFSLSKYFENFLNCYFGQSTLLSILKIGRWRARSCCRSGRSRICPPTSSQWTTESS